jgi:hypothetical protein
VPSEVAVECLVGVKPQELAYDLDGEDLRIRELRSGSAASDAPPFETVVHQTEDSHDEGVKIHEKTSAASGAIESTPSVGRSSTLLKFSRKLAHGVS